MCHTWTLWFQFCSLTGEATAFLGLIRVWIQPIYRSTACGTGDRATEASAARSLRHMASVAALRRRTPLRPSRLLKYSSGPRRRLCGMTGLVDCNV